MMWLLMSLCYEINANRTVVHSQTNCRETHDKVFGVFEILERKH